MNQAVVLLVDNNELWLDETADCLQRNGYRVVKTTDQHQAGRILMGQHVDVVLIDLRLVNDNDRKDISGLTLAQEMSGPIPKVIVTNYPADEVIVQALQPGPDGLAPAVRFVDKKMGSDAILKAVREAIRLPRFRQGVGELWRYIFSSHEAAQRQAQSLFTASLAVGILGVLVAALGLVPVFIAGLAPEIYALALGGLVDAIAILLYQRSAEFTRRADRFHQELLRMRHLENLLEACDEYRLPAELRAAIIAAAKDLWFSQPVPIEANPAG
jgi:CheY-like chemotaxis protein